MVLAFYVPAIRRRGFARKMIPDSSRGITDADPKSRANAVQ